jgi:dihydroxy-acid dehydratase
MVDLHNIGGTPVLLKHLLDAGILDGNCLTASGETLAANLAEIGAPPEGQQLIVTADSPFKPYADMQICFGNLAPEGIVFKVSSMQQPRYRGAAMCFDNAKDVADAVEAGRVRPGTVIVLRNLGPVASGMPEVLIATAALAVPELDGKVAFISDTRVSGVSHGAIGVHCSPEAAVGGPIALVQDGDQISFDLLVGDITLHVDQEELDRRRQQWQPPARQSHRGYLLDFAATTTQASHGCVSKALYPEYR